LKLSHSRQVGIDLQVFETQDEVDAVLQCLPTSDELLKLQPYLAGKRPMSDLAPAERFIMELSKVPQIEMRLTTFRHKFTIPESLDDMAAVIRNRMEAINQVYLVV
jgi:hypothetical protein